MQVLQSGYRGFSLMFDLGADRILVPLVIALGLALGALIGTELVQFQVPAIQNMP